MRNRMKKLTALGLAAILLLGGCAGNAEEEIAEVITPEEEIVETVVPEEIEEVVEEVLPLSINVSTNHKSYYFENSEETYLYLQYCDVEVEGDEYDKLKRNVENWSMERSEGLRSLYASFEEAAEQAGESGEEFYGYSLYQNVSAARIDESIVSLRDDTYQYASADNGEFYREGVNFDAKNGKRLKLHDVISDWENFAAEAASEMIYHLKENYNEELFDDYIAVIETMWAEDAEPEWYMDGSSIVIVVQELSVGPETMGTPEIHLPYTEYERYIKEGYLPGTGEGMAVFEQNQEIYLKLPGVFEEVPMMLQYEWTEEVFNCSLWLGEHEKSLAEFITLEDAYLIRDKEEIYCLVEVDMASDDYVTYVYRLTEGVIEEVTQIGAAIDQGNVNSSKIRMESRVYLLGTYGGVQTYYFDENGEFVTDDTEYNLHRNEYVLKTTADIPVILEDAESILPAGSHIVLNATDGESYVKFTIQETGQKGMFDVRRDENEIYKILIDGMDEYDCFEELPYAG